MEENNRASVARYQQVAADIASKIVDRQYQIGDKIYARSLIASQYSVSSETARRAIAILSDLGIVETTKGSGVVIQSYENALQFVKQRQGQHLLEELKQDTLSRVNRLTQESIALKETIAKLADYTTQFRSLNPFTPFARPVEEGAACVGKSLSELLFWQTTAATVVAIRRGGVLTLSPGPHACLEAGDILYFIGEDACFEWVSLLLGSKPPVPAEDESRENPA